MSVIQREQRTLSGKMLEADFYPVNSGGARLPSEDRRKVPKEVQDKYNRQRAIRDFVRKINCNFDNTDYYMTITYRPDTAPETLAAAEKDIKNYIRRIRYARMRELNTLKAEKRETVRAQKGTGAASVLAGMRKKIEEQIKKLSELLRYAYVIEEVTYRRGENKGKTNYHFHMFVTGGLDRDTAEALFGKGSRVSCDTYKPERFGFDAAALYMQKDPRGKKSFVCSKNMKKPIKAAPLDGRITARGVEKLARERTDDAAYWERRYKGYRFVRAYSRYNSYNGYWYVSVVMYKTKETAPPICDGTDEIFMI